MFRRLLRPVVACVATAMLCFAALELWLPGPLGISGWIFYRSLRTFVRDAGVPTPPSIEGLTNSGPNVIIIVLDCFRHDYLDASAPRLSGLAERAWQYDRYYAAAPWTKPSTASLFTGLRVRRHFVINGGAAQLPQDAVTLAELMQARGFSTAGFVWNPHLARRQAFDQGFDHYVDDARRGSKSLLNEFFSWLDRERPGRFMAYIHFQGTHDPYYADNDLLPLLTAPRYAGNQEFHTVDYKFAVENEGLILSPEHSAHLKYIAEGLASRVDRQAVGGFLDRFEASGLPENTLLVITSDHGDAFFEHGAVSHGDTVYEEEIHVPLIVQYPAGFARDRGFPAAGRARCPTSTVDLLPTVLDFVGAPVPSWIDGVSAIPGRDTSEDCARAVVSEETIDGTGIGKTALVSGNRKLIVDYQSGRREFYDLGADPEENRDLAQERGAARNELEGELSRLLNADGASMATWEAVDGEITDELREELRALGYVE